MLVCDTRADKNFAFFAAAATGAASLFLRLPNGRRKWMVVDGEFCSSVATKRQKQSFSLCCRSHHQQ